MSAIDLALRPACDEDAERIRVTAGVDDVNRWLAAAQHRDRFHYATRPYLPAGAPGPARLRALQAQGLVILFQQRSQLFHGEFCYFAQRTARAMTKIQGNKPATMRSMRSTTARITQVLQITTRMNIIMTTMTASRPMLTTIATCRLVIALSVKATRR